MRVAEVPCYVHLRPDLQRGLGPVPSRHPAAGLPRAERVQEVQLVLSAHAQIEKKNRLLPETRWRISYLAWGKVRETWDSTSGGNNSAAATTTMAMAERQLWAAQKPIFKAKGVKKTLFRKMHCL